MKMLESTWSLEVGYCRKHGQCMSRLGEIRVLPCRDVNESGGRTLPTFESEFCELDKKVQNSETIAIQQALT